MKKIILIGAGGHAKACIDVIEEENKSKIIGIVEKVKTKKKFVNYPIIGIDKDLKKIKKKCSNAIITVGQIKNLSLRASLFNNLISLGFNLAIIISPQSYISKKAKVNNGSIVMHKAVVNSYAEIGSNCIINSSSLIEHGVKVGNHTHVSTGAILNGDCKVGNNSFIGSGTIVKEGVKIGNRCIIGMGQIIKENIKDNQIVK